MLLFTEARNHMQHCFRQKRVHCTNCSKNLQSLQPSLLFALTRACTESPTAPPAPSLLLNYWDTEHTHTHRKWANKRWGGAERCYRYTQQCRWVLSFRNDFLEWFIFQVCSPRSNVQPYCVHMDEFLTTTSVSIDTATVDTQFDWIILLYFDLGFIFIHTIIHGAFVERIF